MNYESPLYIFDLDGTLADCRHRLHYIPHDWPAFHAACVYDQPIMSNIKTLHTLYYAANCDVWIVSGRNECARAATMHWLEQHNIWVENEELMMRADGDFRPEDVVKQEVLDNMLDEDRARIVAVFDDRQRVVDMWRRNGVTCFQVAPGNF
jgi:phosphoglycolate phosphatase-like HAD superfamily hydrolase